MLHDYGVAILTAKSKSIALHRRPNRSAANHALFPLLKTTNSATRHLSSTQREKTKPMSPLTRWRRPT